jgi:hypothetical protein
MLLPSRTVYGTKNWPELGWFEKAGPSGSAFFCVGFRKTEVDSSQASQLPPLTAFQLGNPIKCGSWLACDGGLTAGACFGLKSPSWCKKAR